MFSPPLYIVRKIPFKEIVDADYHIQGDCERYFIKQSDSPMLRQIRKITFDDEKFNKYIIFVDCKGAKNKTAELKKIVQHGFKVNGQKFEISERSASMQRNAIMSFVDSRIIKELNKRVRMDMDIDKTVLSKLYAYMGLYLSSCHCIEDWVPKTIVVPDYYRVIPKQRIKYLYDNTTEFIDKDTGEKRTWTQKDITEKTTDIEINVFDGAGIHHPAISRLVEEKIGSDTPMTSFIVRMPYIKGLSIEVDYETFFAEHGVTEITDIWGVTHPVTPGSEPMMILTESQYKGKKYFKEDGTYADWERYWDKFRKYKHCFGVAKWNFSLDEEPVYTRGNYQILQDLELPYEKFALLATDSIRWIEKIINGDPLYTYCFLGMMADSHKPLNNYAKAILRNPMMMKEPGVRTYLISLIEKYKDDMKCGKLWLKGSFKFLIPDVIMMLEHIGGLEVKGCLKADEFYSFNKEGILLGEKLIERNPHICKSEHTILKGIDNELTQRYCSHLVNTCMVNGYSLTPQRLNGADYDGDLCLLIDNPLMMEGVKREIPIVIDIEDKITALEEEDNPQNKLAVILRGMNSIIGEVSNCSTTYHNKMPKTQEQKETYEKYVNILSIVNGKAIDFAKTGVLFNIPKHIAKYAKPLPYFMKYAGEYYGKLHKFAMTNSNMNRLCREIEKWEKTIRYKRTFKDFDYHIMIDEEIGYTEEHFKAIENIYLEFNKEMAELGKEAAMFKRYDDYKDELKDWIDKKTAQNFMFNWGYYYDQYKSRCLQVCPNIQELANIATVLCYERYPARNKKFLWQIAGDGIVQNIKPVDIMLPQRDDNGTEEYLGKKYTMVRCNLGEEGVQTID